MKILIRRWGVDDYVWRTAKYDQEHFYVDGLKVDDTNIVSVVNDNRKNYVKCSSCNAVIKNNENEIKKHTTRHLTSDTCLGCDYLKRDYRQVLSTKYTKQDDGTYIEKYVRKANLMCTAHWLKPNIDSSHAREVCVHGICATAKMEPITDIFTEMPGVFDHMATVNAIIKVGYIANDSYAANNYRHYKLAINLDDYHVYAVVNKLGIIDHFLVIDGWSDLKVYYSKKFDKLFYGTNYKYKELDTYYAEDLKKEIRKLYS